MTIKLNGTPKNVNDGSSLLDLIRSLGLEEKNTVAEVSGSIVAPENFPILVLKDQDTVELIRFVGGG
jgi:sulfur carrier protein